MINVVILTGAELRHTYFRKHLALRENIRVLGSFCEGTEHSLRNRIWGKESTDLERYHVKAREQSEISFFEKFCQKTEDCSHPFFLPKGRINDSEIVQKIIDLKPDLLVCFGASLINSSLLQEFSGRFLNVHLGLSPYYRGSGTNVWPLINNDFDLVGATFMHLDEGIDTGKVIHQIRANLVANDTPHSIGNGIIMRMTECYGDIILNFEGLQPTSQIVAEGQLYNNSDFDSNACAALYQNLPKRIKNYIFNKDNLRLRPIVNNLAIGSSL